MRKIIIITLVVLLVAFSVSILRKKNSNKKLSPKGDEPPLLNGQGGQVEECEVRRIEEIGAGSQPDYSSDGEQIVFTARIKGDFEVFLMNADGSGRHCITCSRNAPAGFEGKHKGKPVFYPPDSRYLLFSVENEHGDHGLTTMPGIGDNHDLWLTDLEEGRFWRLTRVPADSAIQYPEFSGDGRRLLWSQRYEKKRGSLFRKGQEWGFWDMKLAEFSFSSGEPQLANITSLEPGGKGYYEPHGFLPGSNNKIIMSAGIDPGKSAFYLDIYAYDLVGKKLTKLAGAEDIHYEMATYSPNGQKIALMSGPFISIAKPYRSDLYLMDADGTNLLRLTFFNEPGHKEYVGAQVQIQKLSWHPGGTRIVSAYYNHQTKESKLFKLYFKGKCGAGGPV